MILIVTAGEILLRGRRFQVIDGGQKNDNRGSNKNPRPGNKPGCPMGDRILCRIQGQGSEDCSCRRSMPDGSGSIERREMKIIRVFPHRTSYTPDDDYVFIGMPPFLLPEHDEVHISCTFTWDRDYCKELAYQ